MPSGPPCEVNTKHKQGKIIERSGSAVGARSNMIDVKRGFLTDLRQSAVFATIVRPAGDFRSQTGGNVAHGEIRSARNRSKVRNSARLTKPSASSRSCFVSDCPESWRSSNVCNRAATASGSLNRARSPGRSTSRVRAMTVYHVEGMVLLYHQFQVNKGLVIPSKPRIASMAGGRCEGKCLISTRTRPVLMR